MQSSAGSGIVIRKESGNMVRVLFEMSGKCSACSATSACGSSENRTILAVNECSAEEGSIVRIRENSGWSAVSNLIIFGFPGIVFVIFAVLPRYFHYIISENYMDLIGFVSGISGLLIGGIISNIILKYYKKFFAKIYTAEKIIRNDGAIYESTYVN